MVIIKPVDATIADLEQRLLDQTVQSLALAEQVRVMREALDKVHSAVCTDRAYEIINGALAIQDVASKVLAKRDAEVLRAAALEIDIRSSGFANIGVLLRMAAELEAKSKEQA